MFVLLNIFIGENGFTGWLKTLNSYRIVRLLVYSAKLPLDVTMVISTCR